MFPNFMPKQEQQQIPIWRYSSNAAQIQLARPPKLTYFEVENLLSKTDEDNYVPAIFVRSCNGIRGYGGVTVSITKFLQNWFGLGSSIAQKSLKKVS